MNFMATAKLVIIIVVAIILQSVYAIFQISEPKVLFKVAKIMYFHLFVIFHHKISNIIF
jgi:hypothetical protein